MVTMAVVTTAAMMTMMVTLVAAVAAMVKAWWQWGGLMVVLSFDKFLLMRIDVIGMIIYIVMTSSIFGRGGRGGHVVSILVLM